MKRLLVKHKGKLLFIISAILIPALTYFFPYSVKPKLKFYLENWSTTIKNDKHIDSLSIIYKNRDIAKDSLNIDITQIRIANKGYYDIKEGDYTSQLFGLHISDCKIIGVEVVKEKLNYLNNNLRLKIIDSSTIEINKLAFDCNDEVFFNVIILHKWNKNPMYGPIGKIAGQKKIPILHKGDDEYIDWELIKDLIIVLSIEIPILLLFKITAEFIIRVYRMSRIRKAYDYPSLNQVQTQLVKIYVTLGKKEFIRLMKSFFSGEEFLKKEKEFIDAYNKVNEKRKGKLFFIFNRKLNYSSPFARTYEFFLKKKLLKTDENGNFIISPELAKEVLNTLELFNEKASN